MKKRRDAIATQAKIIESAVQLFCTKGFDATSVDEIAQACEINKAMIYYYYKNKSGLYEEVMSSLMENIYTQMIDSYEKSSYDPIKSLKAFIYTYIKYAFEHPYFPALLLRELSDSGAHLPENMFSKMRQIFKLLSKILKEGEAAGLFFDVKPMMIHFMIIGTINLMVTTLPLREKAMQLNEEHLDICAECSEEDIASYVYAKIIKMLKE